MYQYCIIYENVQLLAYFLIQSRFLIFDIYKDGNSDRKTIQR